MIEDLERLLIRLDKAKAKELLSLWSWRLDRPFTPLVLSVFGDWFLRNETGIVYLLDLVSGELREIATSEEEFWLFLDDEANRKEWLMSHVVTVLEKAGVSRSASECFAFRTPPMLGGQLSVENIVPWDLAAYESGTSKVHRQASGLPPGTEVIARRE